ncbi:MAG: hypothetical protein KatS3mg077_0271 [Candidatus Binatia bacterium]|nr:MAG: hypothetical protein KatS3mg077_0271 [Candidatus Binatia bacterium]
MEQTWLGRAQQTVVLLLLVSCLGAAVLQAQQGLEPIRVSAPPGGGALDADVLFARTNADGNVVLLLTQASNLGENDRNGKSDVYVVDITGRFIERASVSFLGRDPNDGSFPGVLSDDGLLVVFGSAANNLVTGDFNRTPDLFLFDRTSRRTTILTLTDDGLGGGTIPDLPPSATPETRWIAFASQADDLVANDRNEASDVFVLDRKSGRMEAVTLTDLGATEFRTANGPSAGPAISSDGCFVAFFSDANNLVQRDRNQSRDVFVRDRCTNTIERVSVSSDGTEANGPSQVELATLAISGDGRFVAFTSRATNLDGDTGRQSQVFLRDRLTSTTRLVSRNASGEIANAPALSPSLDRAGRFLVFQSAASNLVEQDSWRGEDVFVVDLSDGEVRLVSQPANGGVADGDSYAPSISADGSRVVFLSRARLTPDDTDARVDAYLVANPMFGKPPVEATPTLTPEETPETPTLTPTSTATPTESPSASPTFPEPTPTPVVDATPTPLSTATLTPQPLTPTTTTITVPPGGGTQTPTTPSASPTSQSGGNGGDGCGCRVDPVSGRTISDPLSLWSLLPLLWLAWRRRFRSQ